MNDFKVAAAAGSQKPNAVAQYDQIPIAFRAGHASVTQTVLPDAPTGFQETTLSFNFHLLIYVFAPRLESLTYS